MLSDAELVREHSGTRQICAIVEQHGPLTQAQLSRLAGVTLSCACKCLLLLEQGGYVRRSGQTANRKGMTTGLLPWLYVRTVKPLPDIPQHTNDAPTALELRDLMNAIIRRQRNTLIP